jgi:hypothetical protein
MTFISQYVNDVFLSNLCSASAPEIYFSSSTVKTVEAAICLEHVQMMTS